MSASKKWGGTLKAARTEGDAKEVKGRGLPFWWLPRYKAGADITESPLSVLSSLKESASMVDGAGHQTGLVYSCGTRP